MNKQELMSKPIKDMSDKEREIAARVSNCCCAGIDENSDVCSQCKEHCAEIDNDPTGELQEEFCN